MSPSTMLMVPEDVRALSLSLALFLGCGGQATTGGDAGPSAVAPTADARTPSRGVACVSTTCGAGTEICCIDNAPPVCKPAICSGQVGLQCDDVADCAVGEHCCFTGWLQGPVVYTMCAASCPDFAPIQVCNQDVDCSDGNPCRTYSCGGSIGFDSVALGLCSTQIPALCE